MPSTNSEKLVTLTPNEQFIHMELVKKKVCSVMDVAEVTGNYKTARDTLSRLVKKGYALRVHRGYYAGIPLEKYGEYFEVDRFIVGHVVNNNNGAFAYHSALELHGVAHSYFNTVFYLRNKTLRSFEFQNVEYKYMTTQHLFGFDTLVREGVVISLTDRERTFLDCIRRPDYCGGLEETLKSISTFHSLNYQLLETYLELFGEQSLRQKTGYALSLLQEDMRVPEWFLNNLEKTLTNKTYYLDPEPRKGSGCYVGRWKLIVPKNIKEMMRFV